MKIGIDLSPLQNAHRMRGIGAVLRETINHLPRHSEKNDTYVFFVLPHSDQHNLLEMLSIDGLQYDVRTLSPQKTSQRRLPGKLNLLISALNQLKNVQHLIGGDGRIHTADLDDLDAFIQIDPSVPLPRSRRGLRKALFIHDIIPYVLEWDYLWNYRTARRRGFSRKAAFRVKARRYLYAFKYKLNLRRADVLLANSAVTKDDFCKHFKVPGTKIKVVQLGVSELSQSQVLPATPPTYIYKKTSWGYLSMRQKFNQDTPFILFVGGADKRRRLQDLVAAFNMLRAQGTDLNLVFVGDSMQGPMNIATEEIQHAIRTSSYVDDMLFLGFANDTTLQWLYENALAFVFPSKYEGFGLPVLEAMRFGTPVIAYDNSAAREVAADIPLYANNALEIKEAVTTLLREPSTKSDKQHAIKRVRQYTWDATARKILAALR